MLEALGEFKIKRKLGEGGMGTVYLAYQESLDRDVAIKVLRQKLCDNETFIARFRREARSAASITHPNVIQIYSIGEDQGIHYFVMEYVRGKDLTQLLMEGRRFSTEEALAIILQGAEAIACAAESGIIHRDIKPANIMLSDQNFVKVTDFGLAKSVSSQDGMTEAGTIVGTANYMSPEQGLGKDLDVRTDIYSLGVVFFELLAGRPPFRADHPSSVLYMHIHEPRPVPSLYNKSVPASVDRTVQRMMAIKPEDRPENARQLLAELRGLAQSLGPVNRAAESTYLVLDRPSAEPLSAVPVPAALAGHEASARLAIVADDVPSVRQLYRKILGSLNFTVLEASDGDELLALWRSQAPQIVLLDLNMPRRDGLAILEERQRLNLPGQVIVISAHKERETIQLVAKLGVCSYLTKPVKLDELRSRIMKLAAMEAAAVVPGTPGSSPDADREAAMAVPAAPRVSGRMSPVRPDSDRIPPAQAQPAGSVPEPPPAQYVSIVYATSPYAIELFRRALEADGHRVACVQSTQEVTKILEEDVPDLLVATVSGHDAASISLVEWVQAKRLGVPMVLVLEESDADLFRKMEQAHLGAVLSKPVHLDQFRAAVADALARRSRRAAEGYRSSTFAQAVKRQSERDQSYTMRDFAGDLVLTVKPGLRESVEKRLATDNPKEIQSAVVQLLLRMKKDGETELMLRYIKNAYVKGSFETRWFCLVILPETVEKKVETDLLARILADQDYRIRCQAITRLGELQASQHVPTIVRFLNDEVWKTRKTAAECLERFDLGDVIEPLVQFYAKSRQSLPDAIRNRLLQKTGSQEIDLLEKLAHANGIEVRVFVADLIAQVGSKLSVRLLTHLLKDRTAMVRAAAARAAGRVQTTKMRELLEGILTDANSEVQSAVIGALMQYGLTPGGRVLLDSLGHRGRRIADDAVEAFRQIEHRPDALHAMMVELWQQKEETRKYLSVILEAAFPSPDELTKVVKLLNSPKGTERKDGVDWAVREVSRLDRELQDRMRGRGASS